MEDDSLYHGLGFQHEGHDADDDPEDIQRYLKECLSYHEEQQRIRDEAENNIKFVSCQSCPFEQIDDTVSPQTVPAEETNDASQDPRLEEAKKRAKDILKSFQAQEQQILSTFHDVSMSLPSTLRSVAKRREETRFREALLKNFEYISRKETERLHRFDDLLEKRRIEQSKVSNPVMKHAGGLNSVSGVGTKRRRTVEQRKKEVGATAISNTSTLAIYFSGMPVDGSFAEDKLSNIFGSFGKVEKIHFYREKDSKKLKGDGLILYETVAGRRATELVDLVVSQLNNAELADNFMLSVEPANTNERVLPDNPVVQDTKPSADEGSKEEDDEDLDAFFSNL